MKMFFIICLIFNLLCSVYAGRVMIDKDVPFIIMHVYTARDTFANKDLP